MLLNVLKEGIKDILMKLVIPKKEKGEVKQILKLFEFSKEEQLIILGDKKNQISEMIKSIYIRIIAFYIFYLIETFLILFLV